MWQCERQFSEIKAQHELLRPVEEKMNAAAQKQKVITAKNNTLVNVLTKDRKSWYSIIIYFGAIMPPHVWLNEIAAVDKDMIRINGMAMNYPDVANLLERMEHDDMFADPVLVKADYDPASAATKFEISVKLKGL
jgi:Tfp pilus assembly protein PilN